MGYPLKDKINTTSVATQLSWIHLRPLSFSKCVTRGLILHTSTSGGSQRLFAI